MTETPAARELARILREHQTVATGLGEWACKCSPSEWRPTVHRAAHVAEALLPFLAEREAAARSEVVTRMEDLVAEFEQERIDLGCYDEDAETFGECARRLRAALTTGAPDA